MTVSSETIHRQPQQKMTFSTCLQKIPSFPFLLSIAFQRHKGESLAFCGRRGFLRANFVAARAEKNPPPTFKSSEHFCVLSLSIRLMSRKEDILELYLRTLFDFERKPLSTGPRTS